MVIFSSGVPQPPPPISPAERLRLEERAKALRDEIYDALIEINAIANYLNERLTAAADAAARMAVDLAALSAGQNAAARLAALTDLAFDFRALTSAIDDHNDVYFNLYRPALNRLGSLTREFEETLRRLGPSGSWYRRARD